MVKLRHILSRPFCHECTECTRQCVIFLCEIFKQTVKWHIPGLWVKWVLKARDHHSWDWWADSYHGTHLQDHHCQEDTECSRVIVCFKTKKILKSHILTSLCSDNYSLKFGGPELAWETYFLFFPRVSRSTFKGSHHNTFGRWKFKFLKARHAGCSLSHDPTVLHIAAEEQSSNQNINRAISCNLRNFCSDFLCLTCCDALTKVLMCCSDVRSRCIQLKSCVSQWSQIWCVWHPFRASEVQVCV